MNTTDRNEKNERNYKGTQSKCDCNENAQNEYDCNNDECDYSDGKNACDCNNGEGDYSGEKNGRNYNKYEKISRKEARANESWHEALKRSPDSENTVAVLNCLIKNVGMAHDCINAVLPFVKNERFEGLLSSQSEKYREFLLRARTVAEDMNAEIEPGGKLSQSWATFMIKMKLMMNNSTSKITEMMIQGTTMGVIDMGRLLRHTPDVLPKTLDLAREIMEFEEDKIEILKYFL